MTKRTRLLLAGAAVVLLALIPGSAGADTVNTSHTSSHSGCGGGGGGGAAEAPAGLN